MHVKIFRKNDFVERLLLAHLTWFVYIAMHNVKTVKYIEYNRYIQLARLTEVNTSDCGDRGHRFDTPYQVWQVFLLLCYCVFTFLVKTIICYELFLILIYLQGEHTRYKTNSIKMVAVNTYFLTKHRLVLPNGYSVCITMYFWPGLTLFL